MKKYEELDEMDEKIKETFIKIKIINILEKTNTNPKQAIKILNELTTIIKKQIKETIKNEIIRN